MKKKSGDSGATAPGARGAARRSISPEARALLLRRCRRASMLVEAGELESARRELLKWWPANAERPRTKGLDRLAAAELLLCAGVINGWLVTAKQTKGAQALSKELVAESIRLFKQEGQKDKAVKAQAELGLCLWREGNLARARREMRSLTEDGTDGYEAQADVVLVAAVVELDSGHPDEALDLLTKYAPLFLSSDNETLKGKYHIDLGLVFKELAEETGRKHFLVRAVSEQKAAGYHLARAKAKRLFARSENNLGFALFLLGEFDEAAERLGRAHELFSKLGDAGHAAQVKETQARLLLAWGRLAEAVLRAAEAVCALEAGERPAVLAEALTTKGMALARMGSFDEARGAFDRAVKVAEEAGAWETAGVAALTAYEELRERLDFVEKRKLYERAAALLATTHHYGIRLRLQRAADQVIATSHQRDYSAVRLADLTGAGAANEAPSLRAVLVRLSGSQSPLFITGGRADDRQLLASIAHEQSGRSGHPFVVVDCVTIDEDDTSGGFLCDKVQSADGGTVFLKELQDLPRAAQGHLLRFLKNGVVECGRSKLRSKHVDVRVVTDTSCELSERMRGYILPELFKRLGGHRPLSMPPPATLDELREFEGYLAKEEVRRCYTESKKLPKAAAQILRTPAADVVGMLARHHKRTSAEAGSQDGYVHALYGTTASLFEGGDDGKRVTLAESVTLFKMEKIRDALERVGGSITKAAELLGMPFQTLQNMIKTPKYKELEKARTPVIKRGRHAKTAVHIGKSRGDAPT